MPWIKIVTLRGAWTLHEFRWDEKATRGRHKENWMMPIQFFIAALEKLHAHHQIRPRCRTRKLPGN